MPLSSYAPIKPCVWPVDLEQLTEIYGGANTMNLQSMELLKSIQPHLYDPGASQLGLKLTPFLNENPSTKTDSVLSILARADISPTEPDEIRIKKNMYRCQHHDTDDIIRQDKLIQMVKRMGKYDVDWYEPYLNAPGSRLMDGVGTRAIRKNQNTLKMFFFEEKYSLEEAIGCNRVAPITTISEAVPNISGIFIKAVQVKEDPDEKIQHGLNLFRQYAKDNAGAYTELAACGYKLFVELRSDINYDGQLVKILKAGGEFVSLNEKFTPWEAKKPDTTVLDKISDGGSIRVKTSVSVFKLHREVPTGYVGSLFNSVRDKSNFDGVVNKLHGIRDSTMNGYTMAKDFVTFFHGSNQSLSED